MLNGLNDTSNGDLSLEMDIVQSEDKPLTDSPLLMTESGWNPVKAMASCCGHREETLLTQQLRLLTHLGKLLVDSLLIHVHTILLVAK
jgi:hypothetical protein